MRRVCQVLLVSASVLLPAVPAQAETGPVSTSYWWRAAAVNGGYAVAFECDATADPGSSGDFAVLTTISCTVNGVQASNSAPGGRAATGSAIAALVPVTMCRTAEATFLDFGSGQSYTVKGAEECHVLLAS